MTTQIQIRRDTAANWNNVDPVLAEGEIGMDMTVNAFKVGDGVSVWSAIDYAGTDINLACKLLDAALRGAAGSAPAVCECNSFAEVERVAIAEVRPAHARAAGRSRQVECATVCDNDRVGVQSQQSQSQA